MAYPEVVQIMPDSSEIIPYNVPGLPLLIRELYLSDYLDMRALCHWHEDIEWIYILEGEMNYVVNGKKGLLKKNDCIMVNARQMHYDYDHNRQNCHYICILFHPALFTGFSALHKRYILPVTNQPNLEYLYFSAQTDEAQQIGKLLSAIFVLKSEAQAGYEMEIIGTMHILWSQIYRYIQDTLTDTDEQEHSDLSIQRTMVSYIQQHYGEKITLDQIAAVGNVCRSKCCAIFKHYLNQSPIDFLNEYRIRKSADFLLHSEKNVTQIALTCGFNHLSYYSKLFLRYYQCSPSEYRAKHRH